MSLKRKKTVTKMDDSSSDDESTNKSRSKTLFETPVPEAGAEYDFRIQRWRSGARFSHLLKQAAPRTNVQIKKRLILDENMAFIKLKQPCKTEDLERLCMSIAHPDSRVHIDAISEASLLGITPVKPEARKAWERAIHRTALEHGPSYLDGIKFKEYEYVPDWAITLAFAMVTGTNIVGYPSALIKKHRKKGQNKVHDQIISLFGKQGLEYGQKFLLDLLDENEEADDLERINRDYEARLEAIEGEAKGLLTQGLRALKVRSMKSTQELEEINRRCYKALRHAAISMIAERDVLETYIEAREKCFALAAGTEVEDESGQINTFFNRLQTSLSSLSIFFSFSSNAAPVTWQALGTYITTGAWPTVMAVNPVAFGIGAVGLVIMGLKKFHKSNIQDQTLRHERAVSLITASTDVVNTFSVFLDCLDYLAPRCRGGCGGESVKAFLKKVGDKNLVDKWRDFSKKYQTQSTDARVRAYMGSLRKEVKSLIKEPEAS